MTVFPTTALPSAASEAVDDVGPSLDILLTSPMIGDLSVRASDVYHMPGGMRGFPGAERWVLVRTGLDGLLWWQCVDRPDLTLLLADPFRIQPGFCLNISDADVLRIGARREQDLAAYVLVQVPRDADPYVNVVFGAPVVLNAATRTAVQVMPADEQVQLVSTFPRDAVLPA